MQYDVTHYSQPPYDSGVKLECIQCKEIMITKNHSIDFASETDTLHIELTLVCYTCMIEYTDISGKKPVWHFMKCERCNNNKIEHYPVGDLPKKWDALKITKGGHTIFPRELGKLFGNWGRKDENL